MSYWQSRCELDYYRVVRAILDGFGPLGSILDVGSADTPVVTWGQFGRRITIDPCDRPALPGVEAIRGRWPEVAPELPPRVDVVSCLQVLEHTERPAPFLASLFAVATIALVVSVPFDWPAGQEPSHRHDPVDDATLRGWAGREPSERHLSGDVPPRLVVVYRVSRSA